MSALGGPGLEERIAARARACGLTLDGEAVGRIAAHARLVLSADERLHLTTITDADELLERHIGESLEGAARLPEGAGGTLLDLGSGNGYPGVVVAAARPGLRAVLCEASRRKAAFLREVVDTCAAGGEVFEGQVQRAADLRGMVVDVLTSRAMGAWEKIVPRMHAALSPTAVVLVWAGTSAAPVFRRTVWRRFELVERTDLPGRDASAIWRLRPLAR